MNIKNYTSETSPGVSQMNIERLLVSAGAETISKVYTDGEVTGYTFTIKINGKMGTFKMPAKEEQVFQQLKKRYKKWDNKIEAGCRTQSRRTAWKLLWDWVAIQVSMIEINQVEFMEVFLPYAFDGTRTLFESVKENNYKGLLG